VAPKLAHQTQPAEPVAGADLAGAFDGAFDGEFDGGISTAGRPRLPVGLMVSVLYLKNSFNLSDEELVERRGGFVQWQFFSGLDYYEPRLPCDATQIGRCPVASRGFATTPGRQRRGLMCRLASNTARARMSRHRSARRAQAPDAAHAETCGRIQFGLEELDPLRLSQALPPGGGGEMFGLRALQTRPGARAGLRRCRMDAHHAPISQWPTIHKANAARTLPASSLAVVHRAH
jgi:hypothetical protein